MESFWLIATLVGFTIFFSGKIECNTIFELRLKEFENPGNKLLNGKCCDNQYFCIFGCEHFFEICVKPFPVIYSQCTNYLETRVLAGSKMIFPLGMQLNAYTTNPWIFTYEKPYKGIGIRIKIYDDDSGIDEHPTKDDVVNDYTYMIPTNHVSPATNRSSSVEVIIGMSPSKKQHTRFIFGLRTYCASHYYGKDCKTFCVSQNSKLFGHYTCDSTTGSKICSDGWTGENCNKK